jgi:hypothetical protein
LSRRCRCGSEPFTRVLGAIFFAIITFWFLPIRYNRQEVVYQDIRYFSGLRRPIGRSIGNDFLNDVSLPFILAGFISGHSVGVGRFDFSFHNHILLFARAFFGGVSIDWCLRLFS